MVYGPGRLAGRPERLDLPPYLVVELLSPSSRSADLITKRGDYEAFGVGEYWVVDPAGSVTAKVWKRQGPRLVETAIQGDLFECASVPGFRLDLREVRRALA
jgi:Uma2 family endonuclease